MEPSMLRHARAAALGAFGVAAGAIAFFVLIAFISRHSGTGGMDQTQAAVAWISVGIPILVIVVVHVVYARILLAYAKRGY